MLQVRIFHGTPRGCQDVLNAWLSGNEGQLEISHILQSSSGRDPELCISIFYKTTPFATEFALSEIAGQFRRTA